MTRGAASLLALALAAASATGCGSTPKKTADGASPHEGRATMTSAPEEFRALRATLVRLTKTKAANDADGARGMRREILGDGMRLLKMRAPPDLAREDVPRFLEARGAFGDAMNAYDRAVVLPDGDALWRAVDRLVAAFYAWYDAYRGEPPAGSI